ncbi:MAG: hypothetical protein Q6L60_11445 [Thermostichus sp. HHBFW_bins_43]
MLGTLSEGHESQKNTLTSLLVSLVEKILITSASVAVGGLFLWVAGYPLARTFLLHLIFALLLSDLASWGLDKLSKYWSYRYSKSVASALTPFVSILVFWAVFCRCPIDIILSRGHWKVLAFLLLLPTYKLLHVLWEIFRSKKSETAKQT